ncbi:MAG: LCP family protein [Erysipelotrichaceae bacterium]|nr:LCP family protein [Erysipelotrichaceae bacterium]
MTKKKENSKTTKFIAKYGSKISLLLFIAIGLYFYFVFRSFPMFPNVWGLWLLGGILSVAFIMGLICFLPKVSDIGKVLASVLNVLLCIVLAIASWYLPHIRSNIEKAFAEVPLEGEAEINFYVLKDENQTEKSLADYKDATFIIQDSVDLVNQDYAMLVCKRELLADEIQTTAVESIFDAVDALYAGEGEVMVLNTSYIPMIEDITGYEDFSEKVDIVYTVYKKLQLSAEADSVDVVNKPFNVMIVGNDAYGEVYTAGRTDVNMIASVNPQTKQVSFITVPRDAHVPNACLYDNLDKLTHAGIYGIKCTEETLENYLGIDINYYVVINFSSLIKIVDAIGGIDIYNPYEFKTTNLKIYSGTFPKGDLHLTGNMALAYVRERYSLPNGDFDRGAHQAIVIKAMLNKMTEPAIITKVDKILESLNGTFKTNISMEEIYALAQMQLNDMALWNIVTYSLSGSTGMDYCAAMGTSRTYSVVYLKNSQVKFVKDVIKQVHNGEILTQGTLPK